MERRMIVAASGPAAVADFRLAVQTLQESVLVTGERVKAEVEAQRASTPGGSPSSTATNCIAVT